MPVAESCDVVGVAAEGLVFGCAQFEGAELLVYDLPDDFVGGHLFQEGLSRWREGVDGGGNSGPGEVSKRPFERE